MDNKQITLKRAIDDKELMKVIHKGYEGALSHCFHLASVYTQGFLDGMNYQKDGTNPKTLNDLYHQIKTEGEEL